MSHPNRIILSADDYRDWISLEFEGETVKDTLESICEQIEIPTSTDRLPFVSETYLDAMWKVMSSYGPPGVAPAIGDLTTLDYFRKRNEGWFDGVTASEYGAEIFKQLPSIIAELQRDRLSRRAVIRFSGPKCCESVQFLYRVADRDGMAYPILVVVANFRSSDIIYGIPADYHWLKNVAELVEAKVGEAYQTCIVIHAGSMHVYDRDSHLV